MLPQRTYADVYPGPPPVIDRARQVRTSTMWLTSASAVGAFAFVHMKARDSVAAHDFLPSLFDQAIIFFAACTVLATTIIALSSRVGIAPFKGMAGALGIALLCYQLIPTLETRLTSNSRELEALARRIYAGEKIDWPQKIGPYTIRDGDRESGGVILITGYGFLDTSGLYWSASGKSADKNSRLPDPWSLHYRDFD